MKTFITRILFIATPFLLISIFTFVSLALAQVELSSDQEISFDINFNEPDNDKFRSLALAYKALDRGGNLPCILNAANEVAVSAFLSEKIGFMQIPEVVEYTMEKDHFIADPELEDLEFSDRQARVTSGEYINKQVKEK